MYGARTLVSKWKSKSASSVSNVGANLYTPALLTRTSTCPASAASRRTSSVLDRSAAMNRALPPAFSISLTVLAPRSALRPCTITSAPSRASSSAIARPLPAVAPVTSAVLPSYALVMQARSRIPHLLFHASTAAPNWCAEGSAVVVGFDGCWLIQRCTGSAHHHVVGPLACRERPLNARNRWRVACKHG